MKKVYLLGTMHQTKRYVRNIKEIITKYNIDCILLEGIEKTNIVDLKFFPFLYLAIYLWFKFLKVVNKEGDLSYAQTLAKVKEVLPK